MMTAVMQYQTECVFWPPCCVPCVLNVLRWTSHKMFIHGAEGIKVDGLAMTMVSCPMAGSLAIHAQIPLHKSQHMHTHTYQNVQTLLVRYLWYL
jgi:hypothetical protein